MAASVQIMPCFHPLNGYRSKFINPSGKRGITFSANDGFVDLPITVPCGSCDGCRLERARQWSVRIMHEASLHDDNYFLTLTYDDENLPSDRSLHVEHTQLFWKRYRRYISPQIIRFYLCGEYGDITQRPHYHACVFGHAFNDKELIQDGNYKLYTSASLSRLWGYGFVTIGELNTQTASYVASYVNKKIKKTQEQTRLVVDPATGETFHVCPEFNTQSRRPGIATGWFEKYRNDVYPRDEVIINGRQSKPPKFYDNKLESTYPGVLARIKRKRLRFAQTRASDNTLERLNVRETVVKSKLKLKKREL